MIEQLGDKWFDDFECACAQSCGRIGGNYIYIYLYIYIYIYIGLEWDFVNLLKRHGEIFGK